MSDPFPAFSYRDDPNVPAFADGKPIIVFDGHCVFCSRWARFVLRHDTAGRYRLLPAQTPLGTALYKHYGLDPHDYETNILIDDGRAFYKSDGTIRMIAGLGGVWKAVNILRFVPSPLLDALYGVVARNRLRWFGRSDVCYAPSAADKGRFLS